MDSHRGNQHFVEFRSGTDQERASQHSIAKKSPRARDCEAIMSKSEKSSSPSILTELNYSRQKPLAPVFADWTGVS